MSEQGSARERSHQDVDPDDYRALIDFSPHAYWTASPQGDILSVTQRFVDWAGIPDSGAIAWATLAHPADLPLIEASWQECLASGQGFDVRWRMRTASGDFRWMRARAQARRDSNGKIDRWYGTLEDIDPTQQVEEALLTKERILNAISDCLGWGIWICEPDGRHTYASQPILNLIGKTQQECRDFGWIETLHPDDAERVAALWKECTRTEGKWDVEFRYRGVDGKFYPVLVRGVPVRDDAGQILCWAGINLDVRQLKNAEAALARQVSEFETLFRALPVGVGVSRDPLCQDIRINPAFAELLGVDSDVNASKGRPDREILPFRVIHQGVEIPAEDLPMQVAARTGQEVRNFMYELVRADGVRLVEFGHAAPLFDNDGKVTGSIGVFLDLTELTRAKEELERANAELRQANQDLNQFAFAATHDLQEPLRMITLYSQLFAKHWRDGKSELAELALGHVQEGSVRMQHLLRDLLSFIEVAMSGVEASQTVDLNAMVAGVRENLAMAIEECSAVIDVEELPPVRGHALHFSQLFQNLIGNAIKYRGSQSPHIRIAAQRRPTDWLFSVADNGCGFDPQYSETIFGLFKRLHGRGIPGTGIGLALCQRVVERYGGKIWVESKVDEGSTFYFNLPAMESESPPPPAVAG